MSNLLTASRLRTFRDCAKKEQIAYQQGIRPRRAAEPLYFGQMIHTGLEAWWSWRRDAQPNAVPDALTAALEAVAGEQDPFDRVRAEELLRGYDARWAASAEEYEVLAVEAEFSSPLLNPATGAVSRTWLLAGKTDVIVRHRGTERVAVVEHKTTVSAIETDEEHYWSTLALDHQISLYVLGAEVLGWPVDYCLYDVIRKPGIRPSQVPIVDAAGVKIVLDGSGLRVRTKDGKKWRETSDSALGYVLQTRDETPEEFRARLRADVAAQPGRYFQRREVPRLDEQLQDFLFDTWANGKTMRESQLAGRAPKNPDSCHRFGTCPYWDHCANGLDLLSTGLFVQLDNVHPELKEVTANVSAA